MIQFKRVEMDLINIVTNEKNYETRREIYNAGAQGGPVFSCYYK